MADERDAEAIMGMIHELADYEGTRGDIHFSIDQLRRALEGEQPRLNALLALDTRGAIGMVTYTIDYAIWAGGEVLRVDDVFVRENFRRLGVGRRLMQEIASIGLHRGIPCRWEIEVANTAAQKFYRGLGVDVREKMVARWSLSAMLASRRPAC